MVYAEWHSRNTGKLQAESSGKKDKCLRQKYTRHDGDKMNGETACKIYCINQFCQIELGAIRYFIENNGPYCQDCCNMLLSIKNKGTLTYTEIIELFKLDPSIILIR